ncbi:MAG: FAD-dependent oxidoreductase [Bacteroidota bacterium]
MQTYDFLIIGAGIFGLTTAIELRKRKYSVAVLNPDIIPHPLAASTDISKIVRMEYGSDQEYFDMAEICIQRWREWNDFFGKKLYHEVGMLMLCEEKLESGNQEYERKSYRNLISKNYLVEEISQEDISGRFPAINPNRYKEVHFNPTAGYVEASEVVNTLADYARELGVEIQLGQTADTFSFKANSFSSLTTKEGSSFSAGHCIVAAGTHTPLLLPELQPYMKVSGHPVFHFKPLDPKPFRSDKLGVFMADISNTGWYGFPLHPKQGVIKIGRHREGLYIHPEKDDLRITDKEVEECRDFLRTAIPELANAPLVYTRRCLYTDTLDGHFWIDKHPKIKGLSVSSGGSGHAMKMGPLLGEMTADMVEGQKHRFRNRHRWRDLKEDTLPSEESRFIKARKR